MTYGLLGRKLGHSYSPAIHQQFGNANYQLFEVEPENLEDFLHQRQFRGLNVTMPYKKAVIPYLDELSEVAQKVGAVNTIYQQNGKLIGHNTDYAGFRQMLRSSRLSVAGKKCLILGSGGASDVARVVLFDEGAEVVVISRTGENHYGNLDLHKDAAVIVNATPVGMYPHCGDTPLSLDLFPHLEGVLDVIYNPARTKLLIDAEIKGLTAINGLEMLVYQAQEASYYLTGNAVSAEDADRIYHLLQREMENIILIGMPGCGKSTIGPLVAQALKKEFVDADLLIEELAGISIPQIFQTEGDAGFRALETRVLEDIGKKSGLVIATGGGCVTQARNYPLLHQNGRILWLQRDLDKLPLEGRPLSLSGSLKNMYDTRAPLYHAFADTIIDNNGLVENTVQTILEKLL